MMNNLRKITIAVISVVVTIGLLAYLTLAYLTTLPEPENPYWYYFGPLLFLY